MLSINGIEIVYGIRPTLIQGRAEEITFYAFASKQTSANYSTLPRYSKNIWYSAIIGGRIVAQYMSRKG